MCLYQKSLAWASGMISTKLSYISKLESVLTVEIRRDLQRASFVKCETKEALLLIAWPNHTNTTNASIFSSFDYPTIARWDVYKQL